MSDVAHDLPTRRMELNLGPSHPAMHGTVRIRVELDGETIVRSQTEVGYLHRGFEKQCESVRWAQCMPYADRLNYVSPLINNFGFARAAETLLGVEIPERAKYIRVIAAEISRISDHLTCSAAVGMELGAFTVFLYMLEARELLYDLIEELSGARVTVSYARIGGVAFDLPAGFAERCRAALTRVAGHVRDCEKLLNHNRIFIDRTNGVGVITAQQAVSLGITGPFLRSTGVEYDVRKAQPYDVYARMQFDIPVGHNGDCYDRWLVRLEEIRQSRRIIEQALNELPGGPVLLEAPGFVLPPKEEVYTEIEALMGHFKLTIDGAQVPPGEVYSCSEGANGELGFYIISDGGGRPFKCRVRSPCFATMQALDEVLLPGVTVADVVPIFGSINMIGGECDRSSGRRGSTRMSSITLDGRPFEFREGESIIELATRCRIEIPHYCWHPRLSVAANCRMCLVEIEKAPKLLPACQTKCRDGMVVSTQSPRVRAAQKGMHELLLINHPIDCPICDQAGECKLQDYYMAFGLTSSRMQEPKSTKPRLEQLGPYVLYNGERCVMCTRCVRFLEEVGGERQLGIFERGDRAVIGTFPGKPLDHAYSLNTVDLCPVGALTSSVFRFKQRVWNLRRSPSLCPGCARGCNVQVDHRSGMIYRLLPRENAEVNRSWLCDEGRLTYRRANERLGEPLVRRGDEARAVSGQEALRHAAELLRPLSGAGEGLGVALSLHATCEEAYLLGRLAQEVLGVRQVALVDYPKGEGDNLLRVADRNPNRAGITRVITALGLSIIQRYDLVQRMADGRTKALLLLGHETDGLLALAEAAQRLEVFIHLGHARTELVEHAHVTLPTLPWVQLDGTWVSFEGRAQRLSPAFPAIGAAQPGIVWLSALGVELGAALAFPSAQTIRAEMKERLAAFGGVPICEIPASGVLLPPGP